MTPSADEVKVYEDLLRANFAALDQMILAMQKTKASARDDILGCITRGCIVRMQIDSTPEKVRVALQMVAPDGSTLSPFTWEAARVQTSDLN